MPRKPKVELTPEEKAAKKRRYFKRRVIVYGSILIVAWGFVSWQPWDFDIIPRKLPNPNPPVNPEVERLFAKGTRVLIITAHPDDSAFYIGGTLTQLGRSGAELYQVITTDGDKRYYPIQDWKANRKIRREEAVNEITTWGGKQISFLGYPDGRLKVSGRVVDDLVAKIQQIKPDYILCFDHEYPPRMSHRDHRRSGEAAIKASEKANFKGWIMRFSTIAENYVRDITDDWDAKEKLLAIHASQFFGSRLDGVTNMVMDTAENYGKKVDIPLGEGFRCSKS